MSISAGSRSSPRVTFQPPASGFVNVWAGCRTSRDYSLISTNRTTSQPVWRQWRDHLPHPRRTKRRLWSEQARQVIEMWSRRPGLNGRPAVYEFHLIHTQTT
jgi:hypothetical protein